MNNEYDLERMQRDIVYVKPVSVADLPDDMKDEVGDLQVLFAVHNADGEQLALVANRRLAFHLARENDMEPLTVH